VEAILAESDIYQSEHKSRLATLIKQQASLKANIEENEMYWLELEEQIEEVMLQVSI
jgi:ATP-binding cassette subfamily F protein 3